MNAGEVDHVIEMVRERTEIEGKDVERQSAWLENAADFGSRDARVFDVFEDVVRDRDVERRVAVRHVARSAHGEFDVRRMATDRVLARPVDHRWMRFHAADSSGSALRRVLHGLSAVSAAQIQQNAAADALAKRNIGKQSEEVVEMRAFEVGLWELAALASGREALGREAAAPPDSRVLRRQNEPPGERGGDAVGHAALLTSSGEIGAEAGI